METYRESCDGAIGNPNTVLEVPDGADFITSLLSGHENEGYDFSPVSYKLLLGGEKASVEVHSNMPSPEYHPNTLRVGAGLSNISRDCSGQYLSVVSPKRPSSAASSHLNFDASENEEDDDPVTTALSYGAYATLLVLLAVLTTIFLVCFG